MTDERKIYCVTVETTCYVLAVNEAQAETWAKRHSSDLSDEVQDVFAQTVALANVPKESRGSLPWVAGSLEDDEDELTVEQWLTKTGQV
jgi:hypothetical protein